MGTQEWILAIGVILVPLAIAIIVTLWSLEQARYRPKRKRVPGIRRDEAVTEANQNASDTDPPTPTAPAI